MIDITSVTIGLFVGSCIGFIVAAVLKVGAMDELKEELGRLRAENQKLYREYSRLTDRDSRGRFTGKK